MSETTPEKSNLLNDAWEIAKFVICPPLYAGIRIWKFLKGKEAPKTPDKPPVE